jgi:hypothetical protein
MGGVLAKSLGLSLLFFAADARAQESRLPTLPSESRPLVSLGRPMPLSDNADMQPTTHEASQSAIAPVAYRDQDQGIRPIIFRAQGPEMAAPTLSVSASQGSAIPGSTAAEQYNCSVASQEPASSHPFWDGTKRLFSGIPGFGGDSSGSQELFRSDHAFDSFISPLTNPFFFEDPRALTEIRPIFLHQQSPYRNYIYHGGDIEYLGVQARLAITPWLSLVVNKFGGEWMEEHNPVGNFNNHVGFAELWLGPKITFLRCESTGTIGAAGLTFEIPVGSGKVFQDTGSLTLEPYVTMGQSFLRSNYGTFQALGTFGYNVSVDNQRSDNLFLSLHLDYDIGNFKRIYPLIETHWFHYTKSGQANNIGFEGADLANFGSMHVAGQDEFSIALGARFKLNECIQFGMGVETPLTVHKGLQDFRLTFDMIFRY